VKSLFHYGALGSQDFILITAILEKNTGLVKGTADLFAPRVPVDLFLPGCAGKILK